MSTHETRDHEDQNIWNFILSIFFLAALCLALWAIWGRTGDFPRSIPLFDAILMALAAFRITRLVVYDKITRWFRELFLYKRIITKDDGKAIELTQYPRGFRRTISDLLGCPWCIGFWSSLIIVFCYYLFAWAWIIILFLAVAGASSFVQLSANLIGWHAEHRKLVVKETEAGPRG